MGGCTENYSIFGLAPGRERLRWQIEAGDLEIDALVYELYGLTEAEIRLVEEKQA